MAKGNDCDIDIKSLQKAVLSANEDAMNSFPVSILSSRFGYVNDIPQGSLILCRDCECGTRRQPSEFDRDIVNSPNDLFYKDGKSAKRIFLLGEAGYGKTTFCLQLLSHWCSMKKSESVISKVHRFFRKSDKSDHYEASWENFVEGFDLAFYVSLSHVGLEKIALQDMCCSSIFDKKLRQKQQLADTLNFALQDRNCSCLVMIDSLDDWLFYNDLSIDDMYSNLLDESIMPNCTVIITCSPSKFELLTKYIRPYDRVVELVGLDMSYVKAIFRKTLLEILGKESSEFYKKSYSSLIELLKNPAYARLLKAPVFASIITHICHYNKGISDNWTEFYGSIVDSLILRAKNNKKVKFHHNKLKLEGSQGEGGFISEHLSKFKTLTNEMTNLVLLGRAAYDGLMSNPPQIKFEEQDLFDNIGDVIDFGLETGLLVETHPPSKAHCSVQIYHFLHKSIQEFLAAIFVSYLKKEKISHLLGKCNTLEKILDQSELLVFVMGLCPDVGAVLSEHIKEVAISDPDIQKYRQTFHTDKETKVTALFTLLTRGYRESLTSPLVPKSYHVTDAILTFTSYYYHLPEDIDLARLTFDLLTQHHQSLLSMCLKGVPDDPEKGISDTELTQLLDKIVTLKSLCIFNMSLSTVSTRFSSLSTLSLWYIPLSVQSKRQLEDVLSSNSILRNLELGAFFGVPNAQFCLNLESCKELSHLSLISMDIEKLEISKENLASLVLQHVKGSATGITDLIGSLNQFHVLRALRTEYLPESVSREAFLETIPTLNTLHTLVYHGSLSSERVTRDDSSDTKYDNDVVKSVLMLPYLRHIEIGNVDLSEHGLCIPISLTELEVLQLGSKRSRIKMSNQGWRDFVKDFNTGSLSYELHLYDTDMDDKAYQILCSAPGIELKYCQGKFGVQVKKFQSLKLTID